MCDNNNLQQQKIIDTLHTVLKNKNTEEIIKVVPTVYEIKDDKIRSLFIDRITGYASMYENPEMYETLLKSIPIYTLSVKDGKLIYTKTKTLGDLNV
jgi:hypothetical protein